MMFQILKLPDIRKLLILATLLRLLVMPFYFHPDIKTYHFQASFLKLGVGDIYSYLESHRTQLPLKEEFVYFPLTYFFLGAYQLLISPLLGNDFDNWLQNASASANEQVGVYRYLLLLKLPYLILDILIALMLTLFFASLASQKRIFTLWLFNPLTIILIYGFSNVDIVPVALTVVSLLLAKNNRLIWSGLLLGLAASFKAYPLLFLPFLFIYAPTLKQKVGLLVAALGVFSLVLLPFAKSVAFQQAALVSGLTTRIVFPGLSIGFGQTLMASVMSMFGLVVVGLLSKPSWQKLWAYYLAILLLLISFIHFHIQWLLWLMPLVVLLTVMKERLGLVAWLLIAIAFVIPVLLEDRAMSVGLLSAVNSLYNLVPTPFALVQKLHDPYVVMSVLHSMLAGGSLVLIWQILKEAG